MRLTSPAHRIVSPVAGRVPHVVIVDPNFERYGALIASERQGRITLHLRSSGRDALRLLDREDVDAWIIGTDLDDMSGHDFAELLRARLGDAQIGIVSDAEDGDREMRIVADESRSVGADVVLEHPISLRQLDTLLGMPTEERSKVFPVAASGSDGIFASLQLGISAAAAVVAVLIVF
jgi:CheY-like chemotaxis protein